MEGNSQPGLATSIVQKSQQGQMLLDQLRGLVPAQAIARGNTPDYDLGKWVEQADYKDVANLIDKPNTAHFNDIGKMPNHMTFSNESYYSNNKTPGGMWSENNGKWQFNATPFNLTQHNAEQLKNYFKQVEPDSTLILPSKAKTQQWLNQQGLASKYSEILKGLQ